MTLSTAQLASLPGHACAPIAGVQRCYFVLQGARYYAEDWSVWKIQNGATVYVTSADVSDSGGIGAYLWITTFQGAQVVNRGSAFAANQYLGDPLGWQTSNNAHRVQVQESSGGFAHFVSNAVHSIGHLATDVVDFGIEVNSAVLHPLTVNSSGLQLSSSAIALVPDQVQGLAQSVTSVLGYGVLAGAAVTALGGISAVTDAIETGVGAVQDVAGVVSGISGAVQTAQSFANTLGLLPSPGFISTAQAAQASAPTPSNTLALLALATIAYVILRK